MKHLWHTIRHYYLFVGAAAGTVVALGLQVGSLPRIATIVLIAVSVLELLAVLGKMLKDLRAGTYGVDILAAIAIIASIWLQQYWAGIVIVLMLTGGEALEHYAGHRARSELEALLNRAPQKAHVVRGRKTLDVLASEVRSGDKLIIRPGELVPVDATILEGTASFDESSLTGESVPQDKDAGDSLLSGSVNLDGLITAKALHTAEDSQYQQIIRLVQAARGSQAPFVRLADRYAIPFTIVALGIAIGAWAWSGEALRFLEVIVVATPCPLILAAPIAVISGMSRSAKHGIIIKSGTSLERLAMARTFAFDKTGTLTLGELHATKVTTFSTYKRTEVLAYAASLEQGSNHAQAQAIVRKAQAERAKFTPVKHVREVAGKGLSGTCRGKTVLVGRLILLQDHAVEIPKSLRRNDYATSTAFIAIDGRLAGAVSFADEVRPDSKATLARLKHLGVEKFLMVTGDTTTTAKAVARQLGIQDVIAEALPGDKIMAIEKLQPRPVAFVGDGVNDAPVLTAADVGIALGARGSAAASESADVVVMLDDINRVATGVAIAKRTFGIARQSIVVGIGLSVGLMVIFASGRFLPIYGAVIQEVVDVVVIFNALRAHGGGHGIQTTDRT